MQHTMHLNFIPLSTVPYKCVGAYGTARPPECTSQECYGIPELPVLLVNAPRMRRIVNQIHISRRLSISELIRNTTTTSHVLKAVCFSTLRLLSAAYKLVHDISVVDSERQDGTSD
jgi:hypothetical protein